MASLIQDVEYSSKRGLVYFMVRVSDVATGWRFLALAVDDPLKLRNIACPPPRVPQIFNPPAPPSSRLRLSRLFSLPRIAHRLKMTLSSSTPTARVAGVSVTLKPRKPYSRSRTGCLTCRQKHLKCDENRPIWSVSPDISLFGQIAASPAAHSSCGGRNLQLPWGDGGR